MKLPIFPLILAKSLTQDELINIPHRLKSIQLKKDANLALQNLPEFGTKNNMYSSNDMIQVNHNIDNILSSVKQTTLIKQHEDVSNQLDEVDAVATDSNDEQLHLTLKAAFAPGKGEFYKNAWFNFKYKNIYFTAGGLWQSKDRKPPHCQVYNPKLYSSIESSHSTFRTFEGFNKLDFINICSLLRENIDEIQTDCAMPDNDRNGGTCKNYRAFMSFENSGKPDIWLNANSFTYRASHDPEQECNLYQYHEYSTVVYACENKLDLTNSFFKKSPPKFLEAVPFQGRSSQSFLIQPVQVVSNDEEHSAFDPIPNFASRSQNSITFGDFDFNQDQTGDLNWADGPDFVDLSHMFDGTSLDLMELNSISGGDSQNGDSSPKKSNAIGNRIQASSTKELLTKILTRFNLQHEIKSLENHGCWCPFLKDSIIGGHLGHPVDDLDSLCRSHHTCMNCARFEPSPCSDYLISQPDFANSPDNILDDNYYLFFNQKDGIWECEDRQDSCLKSRCECDLNFVIAMKDKILQLKSSSKSPTYKPIQNPKTECPRTAPKETYFGNDIYYQNSNDLPTGDHDRRSGFIPPQSMTLDGRSLDYLGETLKSTGNNVRGSSSRENVFVRPRKNRCCGSDPASWLVYDANVYDCVDQVLYQKSL